jgi:hypothetical protein
MQYAPARKALAGSVLVLGSVGTVSAVHLDSATLPASPDGGSSVAMAPPALPDTRPASPQTGAPSVDEPAAATPSRDARTSIRASPGSAHRPVTSRDLIDMAHGPRGGDAVVVPVHDIERTVALRSTLRTGGRDVIGAGLQSLDDVLDLDHSADFHRPDSRRSGFHSSGFHSADFPRTGFHRAEFRWADGGYSRVSRSDADAHRADVSWDSDDVSYSRPQCGRHRA